MSPPAKSDEPWQPHQAAMTDALNTLFRAVEAVAADVHSGAKLNPDQLRLLRQSRRLIVLTEEDASKP